MLHIFDNQAAITSQVDVNVMMTVDFTAVEKVCNLIDQLVKNSPGLAGGVSVSNGDGVLPSSIPTATTTTVDPLNQTDKEMQTEHNAESKPNTKKPTRSQSTHRKSSLAYVLSFFLSY